MHQQCGLTWGYEMPRSLVMADSTTMVLVTNLIAEYSSPFRVDVRHGNVAGPSKIFPEVPSDLEGLHMC